jgi:ATP-dependent Clp protease, protease subunit
MNKFRKLSDKKIQEIWSKNQFTNDKEIHIFRKELVKRGFVSWDEINTKFECIPLRKKDEEPEEDEKICEKKERFSEEFYYKILNKHRYIFLYDEINNVSADMVCSKLRAMNYLNNKEAIFLEINSPGGYVTYGLSIIDTISSIEAPVYTIISGEACSMAAMISIVGKKRYITINGFWMQHSTSDLLQGNVQNIKDQAGFLLKLERHMTDILKKNTKLNQRQLTQIRNGQLWLFAEDALKYGVVDKILYPKK